LIFWQAPKCPGKQNAAKNDFLSFPCLLNWSVVCFIFAMDVISYACF